MCMTSSCAESKMIKVCEHPSLASISWTHLCTEPFLPVREEFHPKRNQARQKLATLPSSRFEDLSSDVYFELVRRYPEFKEDVCGIATVSILYLVAEASLFSSQPSGGRNSQSSTYDDYPAPGFPSNSTSRPRSRPSSHTPVRASSDREQGSGYRASQRPSEDRRQLNEDYQNPGRTSEDKYRRPDDLFAARDSDVGFGASDPSKSAQSQEFNGLRRSEDRDHRSGYVRQPSAAVSTSGNSDTTTSTVLAAQSATAISGIIIPTKSTIEEEDIKIPYGQDKRESGSTTMDERSGEILSYRDIRRGTYIIDGEPDSASDYPSPMSPRSPPAGLGGLAARLRNVGGDDDDDPGRRSGGEEYFSQSSVSLDGAGSGLGMRMRSSLSEEQEKMKRDYDYKIATMQSQISNLLRDLEANTIVEKKRKEEEATLKARIEESESLRRVSLFSQLNIIN